jgi:shikimate kinase
MLFKNVSLIGFMGSGKSTIGKILAKDLNFLFIDVDKIIEYISEMTISEIFNKYGEEYFRKLESEVIKKIYVNNNCIFACGGGVFLKKRNINVIKKNSLVIYLEISEEEAFNRLKNSNNRPLIEFGDEDSKKEKISKLLEQRRQIYEENCDIKINTNNKKPQEIKDEILKFLKDNK